MPAKYCKEKESVVSFRKRVSVAPSKEDALALFNNHAEELLQQFGFLAPTSEVKVQIVLEQGKGLFFPAAYDSHLALLLQEPCFQENIIKMAQMTLKRIEKL